MVLPDSARVPRVPAYSGSASAHLLAFRIRDSHPLRSYVPVPFRYASVRLAMRPHNPRLSLLTRVWAVPFSLAATLGISIDFFSSRYLDVSVPWVGSLWQGDGTTPAGFPHSDTPGSKLACNSPRLFAACHVLLRRSVPRHPPCALSRLTSPLPSTGSDRPRRRAVRPRIIVHRARPPSPPTRTLGRPPIGRPERPKALVLPSTLIFKHPGPCRPGVLVPAGASPHRRSTERLKR